MKVKTVTDAMEFLIQELEDYWRDIQEADPDADLDWEKLEKCRSLMINELYLPAKIQFPSAEEAQTMASRLPRLLVTKVEGPIVSVRGNERTLDMYGTRPGAKVIMRLRN